LRDFDAVIFDMDGVIFDSERCVIEVWKEIAKRQGIRDIEKNLMACIGTTAVKTRQIMLEAYGEGFPYDELSKQASAAFHERYDNGKLPLKTGVFEILDFLKDNNKKITLATSTRRQVVVSELESAGLFDYFDEIITGDMVSKSKPDPEIFLLACKRSGIREDAAFVIEDSYNGIRAAHAGGLKAIMVPDLLPANDEMRELSRVILDDLVSVISFLSE